MVFVKKMGRVAIALLSIVVALLGMEVAARLYAKVTRQERGVVFDPELGWRLLPNVRKVGHLWGRVRPASTNSKGWRDVEHSYDKPNGVRRVLALGDSYTFGVGVDDGERFTDVLARHCDRVEIINLGVTGYGTDQELRVLELEGFRHKPDIVVLVVSLGNDLDDIRCERRNAWPKPSYTLEDGELRLTKPHMTWDVRLRTASYLFEYLFRRMRNTEGDSRLAPMWENTDALPLFKALVRSMATESAQRGAHFLAVLAYFSRHLETGPTEQEQQARAALEEMGIATLDTHTLFVARAQAGETLYASDQVHWNARGHAVVADAIREMLLAQGWLD
jgi:lysophospholipase L1-like esterase